MASDRPVVFTSPQTAGDQKPFGSTIAEWHLATAGLEIGGASAWLYGVSTGILEVGAVSALGSTMVLAVGVAVLVVATLEALGMPVPDKTVQIITDLSGGPSSLVGGVIGAGLNGQNGLEQGARLGGILDLAMGDRDAVSAFWHHSDTSVKILQSGTAIAAHLSTFTSSAKAPEPPDLSRRRGASDSEATVRLQRLTSDLKAAAADTPAVRWQLPQTYSSTDFGDRWTASEPVLPSLPEQHNPSTASPSPSQAPTAPPPPHPASTPPPSQVSPSKASSLTSGSDVPDPYECSSAESDAQQDLNVRLP